MSLLQSRSSRFALTALAVAALGLGAPLLASADPSPAASCLQAGNVWVHIELDDTVAGGCATEFATGAEALASAGFDVDISPIGFVDTIDGAPADPRGAEDWWAYAHSDEELVGWTFYEVGVTKSAPVAGSIESWRLMHTWDQDVSSLPLVTPEQLLADVEQEGTPAPTPSAAPSVTASATPSPTPTAGPTPTSGPTPTAVASVRPAPSLPKTGN